MAEYLKKKKIYSILKELVPNLLLPAMKDCAYKSYRGDEWLICGVGDSEQYMDEYCLWRAGNMFDIRVERVYWEDGRRELLQHKAYRLEPDQKFILSYDLEEMRQRVQETRKWIEDKERHGIHAPAANRKAPKL